MDCIDIALMKLKNENIYPSMQGREITWSDNRGDNHFIRVDNIDCWNGKIAWFQSSDRDNHLLRVFENEEVFKWEPITHNPVFGCDCHLLEWYKGYLIFIYKEKHETFICSVKHGQVETFKFHGEALERKENIILFETYGPDTESVRRIKIPELIEIEPLSRDIARQDDLLPKSVSIAPDMYLKRK